MGSLSLASRRGSKAHRSRSPKFEFLHCHQRRPERHLPGFFAYLLHCTEWNQFVVVGNADADWTAAQLELPTLGDDQTNPGDDQTTLPAACCRLLLLQTFNKRSYSRDLPVHSRDLQVPQTVISSNRLFAASFNIPRFPVLFGEAKILVVCHGCFRHLDE